MTGISNGMLLAMTAEQRADTIADLSPEARRTLAHIAVLGANKRLGDMSDALSAQGLYLRDEARALLSIAIELARSEQ